MQGELSALTGRTSFAVQTITSGLGRNATNWSDGVYSDVLVVFSESLCRRRPVRRRLRELLMKL